MKILYQTTNYNAKKNVSETDSHQELPKDYIIPRKYYDNYRLVFSHYKIDRKIARIGRHGKYERKGQISGFGKVDNYYGFIQHS